MDRGNTSNTSNSNNNNSSTAAEAVEAAVVYLTMDTSALLAFPRYSHRLLTLLSKNID